MRTLRPILKHVARDRNLSKTFRLKAVLRSLLPQKKLPRNAP